MLMEEKRRGMDTRPSDHKTEILRVTSPMSGDRGGGIGDFRMDKDDSAWPILSRTTKETRERSQGVQSPKKVTFQTISEASSPAAAGATPSEKNSTWSSSEMSESSEVEKGDTKGKGKGGSGAKGGQRGSNPKSPKGKGEDHQGIRKDLEKIEQKVDILLEKMDKFTKGAEATLLDKEEAMKPQPPPSPPQKISPQPGHPHGGKSHKKSKGAGKAAAAETGSGGKSS
ncbi:uncharacterized protein LOC141502076 isoform X2 [Macrotis lagotis]|uniref:uncharacterized protein LOC141502076 isoform X2 n=1 Tax=Macrotis lagotis TaxID=92651 RepID=UPI003D69A93C